MANANEMKLERRAPKWMFWIERVWPWLGGRLGQRWLIRNQPAVGFYNLAPGGQFRATLTEPLDHSFDMPLSLRAGTVDIVD